MIAKLSTNEMIALYQRGYTMENIAERAGISRQAVYQRLHRVGIDRFNREPSERSARVYSYNKDERRLLALQHIKDAEMLAERAESVYKEYLKQQCEIDRIMSILRQNKRDGLISMDEFMDIKATVNSKKPLKKDIKKEIRAE